MFGLKVEENETEQVEKKKKNQPTEYTVKTSVSLQLILSMGQYRMINQLTNKMSIVNKINH